MENNDLLQKYGMKISQDKNTGFLSLSDLQELYSRARLDYGWRDKRVSSIWNSESTKCKSYYILKDLGIVNYGYYDFMDEVRRSSLIKVLKRLGVYKTYGARETKKSMCHPSLWLLAAFSLNDFMIKINGIPKASISLKNRMTIKEDYGDIILHTSRLEGFNIDTLVENLNTLDDNDVIRVVQGVSFLVESGMETSFEKIMGIIQKCKHKDNEK